MFQTIGLVLALIPLFILYLAAQSYYNAWQYNRKAAAWGCKPAALRHYKYPGGFDMIQDVFAADKRQQIPNFFEDLVFNKMKGKDTFRQYFFGKLTLATTNPENIQTMLAKKFDDFEVGEARRGSFWPLLGNGIFTADGNDWSHGRALLRPQFARNQVADVELEERHVQDLLRHLPSDQNGSTGEVNLQPLFFRLTLDSATEFLFGESVQSLITSLPTNLKSEKDHIANATGLDLVKVSEAFDGAMASLGKRGRLGDKYWLYNPSSFKEDCTLVHKFADFFVHRALSADLEKATASGGKYVFLNELAKATRDPIEIRSQLLNIFLAGRDTTAGLLGWVFWILARHPEILSKLRASILADFGTFAKPRDISFATLKANTYLQHVLSECLRLYPSVPLNSRRANKDTTIPIGGGPDGKSPVFVPQGTQVDYAVHVMHRRPEIWGPDAHIFNPDRWIGRKSGWEFLPFNGGPRICLGQQFALTEAGYVTVRLLQRFEGVELVESAMGGTESVPFYQYSVTTAPVEVRVRMRLAKE